MTNFPTFASIFLALGLFGAGFLFGMTLPVMAAVGKQQPPISGASETAEEWGVGGWSTPPGSCEQSNPFCPYAVIRPAEGLGADDERSELVF